MREWVGDWEDERVHERTNERTNTYTQCMNVMLNMKMIDKHNTNVYFNKTTSMNNVKSLQRSDKHINTRTMTRKVLGLIMLNM